MNNKCFWDNPYLFDFDFRHFIELLLMCRSFSTHRPKFRSRQTKVSIDRSNWWWCYLRLYLPTLSYSRLSPPESTFRVGW